MAQLYSGPESQNAPIMRLRSVTPSDTVDISDGPCRALNVSATGTLSVIAAADTDAVAITVVKGWNPVAVRRVRSTGSDAMTIIAGY
jgi:hypothetical protein